MSQRFNLFFAGNTATAPTFYFKQLDFCSQPAVTAPEGFREQLNSHKLHLDTLNEVNMEQLLKAGKIALDLQITVPALPDTAPGYQQWLKEYNNAFEVKFPMSRIDFYYFFYGRKLAEIHSNVNLARFYLGLGHQFYGEVDLSSKADNTLKDAQFVIFKLIAAAALLSSEPRLNFFNVFYRKFNSEFEPFKDIRIPDLSRDEMKAICEKLESYNEVLEDGYKKCLELLTSMGI